MKIQCQAFIFRPLSNSSDNQNQLDSSIINQNLIIDESSSLSELTDDTHNGDKRKQTKNQNVDANDNETQLSSSIEKEEQLVDGI